MGISEVVAGLAADTIKDVAYKLSPVINYWKRGGDLRPNRALAPLIELQSVTDYTIQPESMSTVRLGVAVEMPPGFVGVIAETPSVPGNHLCLVGTHVVRHNMELTAVVYNRGSSPKTLSAGSVVAVLVPLKTQNLEVRNQDAWPPE